MSINIKFLEIAKDKNLNAVLKQLIPGRYVLNQQNAVVNPPKKQFDQAKWHRDLPYQHYTSNRPLAINDFVWMSLILRMERPVLYRDHICIQIFLQTIL